jgi:hypothetical protein
MRKERAAADLMLTTEHLRAVRGLALRKRVWYRALDGLERGIVNLTIKLVESVKSLRLAETISEIMLKLEGILKSKYTRQLEAYGYSKMREVIAAAVRLGCKEALSWASESFARLLTLNNMRARNEEKPLSTNCAL